MKRNTIKRALAGVLAVLCVAGYLPANVGTGGLFNSTAIVANAETVEWNEEPIYGYHEINSDVSVVTDTLSMITGGIVIINGDLTLNDGAELLLYNGSVLIVNGNISRQGGKIIAGDSNCVAISVPGKSITYNQDTGCYVSNGKTYQFEGTPPRLVEIVHGTSIADAAVNLNPDHTVASLTVGEETITDLSDFDITYGTSDNNHTSTTVPTAANTYYAYVTPKSGNINYTGTAKSTAFSIQVGNNKETGTLGGFNWTLDTNDVMTFSGSGSFPPVELDLTTFKFTFFRENDNVVKKIVFAPDCGAIDFTNLSLQEWTALEEIEINSTEELHLTMGIAVITNNSKLSRVTVNAPTIILLEEVPFRSSIPIDLTLNTDALYVAEGSKFNQYVVASTNTVHIPKNSFIVPPKNVSFQNVVDVYGYDSTDYYTQQYQNSTSPDERANILSIVRTNNGTIDVNQNGAEPLTRSLHGSAFGGATVIAPTTDISPAVLTFDKPSVAYTGNEITPVLTVKYGDKTLTEGVDYEIADSSSTSATAAGDYTVTINGIGDYSGTVSAVWQITNAVYMTKVEATAATADTAGNVEYYEGSDANCYLLQNDRYKETTLEEIKALSEQFSEEVNKTTTLKGRSISLGGDIGVNFYYEISSDIAANAKAELTVGGVTQTVDGVYDSDRGQYKFTVLVNSSQTSQEITCKIVSDDYVSEAVTYSVNQYIDSIKDDTNYNSNAKLMALVNAISVYGYYANEQFGTDGDFTKAQYFNDAFINTDKTEYAADLESLGFNSYTATNGTVLSYYGSSLLLESKTTLRHYFTLNEGQSIDGVTFTVGSTTVSPKYKDGLYYVDIPNISSAELYNKQTITGSDGTTVEYYPLTYAYKVLTNANSSEKLINVVKALCEYAKCADNYFPKQ